MKQFSAVMAIAIAMLVSAMGVSAAPSTVAAPATQTPYDPTKPAADAPVPIVIPVGPALPVKPVADTVRPGNTKAFLWK